VYTNLINIKCGETLISDTALYKLSSYYYYNIQGGIISYVVKKIGKHMSHSHICYNFLSASQVLQL